MGHVEVYRENHGGVDRLLPAELWIDNIPRGSVLPYETVRLDVKAGSHLIEVKADDVKCKGLAIEGTARWGRSAGFDVSPGHGLVQRLDDRHGCADAVESFRLADRPGCRCPSTPEGSHLSDPMVSSIPSRGHDPTGC